MKEKPDKRFQSTRSDTLAKMIASIPVAGYKPRIDYDEERLKRLAEHQWSKARARKRRKPSS